MTDSKQTQTPKSKSSIQFWNRVQLILILVVFAAPIVGAFLYKPKSFINYGDLYSPSRDVPNLVMQGTDGDVEMDSFRRQWIFLVTANGECDEACEDNILKMRQLRFMQNNNMTRIRTVFLETQLAPEVAADLTAKYSPVEHYSVPLNKFEQWTDVLTLPEPLKSPSHDRLYIIDPAGKLMISYPQQADPNLIKKDIKRLLKASKIG